jgi:hypothetical protein
VKTTQISRVFSRFLREKFTHRGLFKAKQGKQREYGAFLGFEADGTVFAKEMQIE